MATFNVVRSCYRHLSTIKQSCFVQFSTLSLDTPQTTAPFCTRNVSQSCRMSSRQRPEGSNFFKQLTDNIKQEFSKNKEMSESLQKFRQERERLEQSDALKKAREKYEAIESETSKSSDALRQTVSDVSDKIRDRLSEVEKTELAKTIRSSASDFKQKAGKAAETVAEGGKSIAGTATFQKVKSGVESIKSEIDETTLGRARLYSSPETLRLRSIRIYKPDEKPVDADETSTGVVRHKDSVWTESWQSFKENNVVINKMFEMKMKYDESDSLAVRATRAVTEKVGDLFGGLFTKTELSEVLTEIVKMDPSFEKEKFLMDCQFDIIPNVLEAICRGDLAVLEDWCHQACFNMLAQPLKLALQQGYSCHSKVLDVNSVDLISGKMMEQGPVLVISFSAQQIMVIKNRDGKVVEGDVEKIMKVFHVWALCRDQTILDPQACWRVIDLSSNPQEQWI